MSRNYDYIRNGVCSNCLEFSGLFFFRKRYLCRDCFVGDYDPEYIKWKREALLAGPHHLAIQEEEEKRSER